MVDFAVRAQRLGIKMIMIPHPAARSAEHEVNLISDGGRQADASGPMAERPDR
jgi:hypothetical protein